MHTVYPCRTRRARLTCRVCVKDIRTVFYRISATRLLSIDRVEMERSHIDNIPLHSYFPSRLSIPSDPAMASSRVFNARSTAWTDDWSSSAVNVNASSSAPSRRDGQDRRKDGRALAADLPSAAELFVPSLPGIGSLAQHPT
jgi:hypothetical protein